MLEWLAVCTLVWIPFKTWKNLFFLSAYNQRFCKLMWFCLGNNYWILRISVCPYYYLMQVHSTVRRRWLEGDELVRSGMTEIAELAVRGHAALLKQDFNTFAELMNQNFDLRRFVSVLACPCMFQNQDRAKKRFRTKKCSSWPGVCILVLSRDLLVGQAVISSTVNYTAKCT